MCGMNESDKVKGQYATAEKLNIRIGLHQKYSTNKEGFGNWIYRQYSFKEGDRILELGCGTGDMWINRVNQLPKGASLTLTDFSAGMLESARAALPNTENLSFLQADIQSIPFKDNQFDVVIANMMLYHVPDLHKGLSEVQRVLKPGGTFYCATYGENGIAEYVCALLSAIEMQKAHKLFTLQNGEEILNKYFNAVQCLDYDDALMVSDVSDIISYMESMTDMVPIDEQQLHTLKSVLESRKINGFVRIPKEYGMFVCKNSSLT